MSVNPEFADIKLLRRRPIGNTSPLQHHCEIHAKQMGHVSDMVQSVTITSELVAIGRP